MKFKILSIVLLAFIQCDCSAYVLVIKKTKIGGDESGNYDYTNRTVTDYTVDIEGIPRLQTRTVSIFCEGTGENACPDNIAYIGGENEEQPAITELFTLEALNAAQALLNNAEVQSSFGQGSGNESGTILTPDGRQYLYSISWNADISGVINIYLIFQDAP